MSQRSPNESAVTTVPMHAVLSGKMSQISLRLTGNINNLLDGWWIDAIIY